MGLVVQYSIKPGNAIHFDYTFMQKSGRTQYRHGKYYGCVRGEHCRFEPTSRCELSRTDLNGHLGTSNSLLLYNGEKSGAVLMCCHFQRKWLSCALLLVSKRTTDFSSVIISQSLAWIQDSLHSSFIAGFTVGFIRNSWDWYLYTEAVRVRTW